MLRALALVFALFAVCLMVAAIVGMVTGRPAARAGGVVRALSVVCFATAVILNVAAH